MGWRLYGKVLDHAPAGLTSRERRALEILAFTALDDGKDTRIIRNLENPRLMHRLQLSRSQLYIVIGSLVAKGLLERKRRGQRYSSAEYLLTDLATSDLDLEVSDLRSPHIGLTNKERSRNRDAENPETGTQRTPKPGRREPSLRPRNRDAETLFADWWDAYPRQAGRPDAAQAWTARLTEGADPEELIAAATRFAESRNGTEPQKICWPGKWLRERWDLDYPPEHKTDLGGSR